MPLKIKANVGTLQDSEQGDAENPYALTPQCVAVCVHVNYSTFFHA